jgi:hypothetical protein
MSRLIRTTLAAYYDQYVAHQFAPNHNCFLDGFDSELVAVRRARIIPRLYVVSFSDHTESIVDCNAVVYIQTVPGTLRNW